MPIAPRFRRVAALQRPFVNREALLTAFAEEQARVGGGPRVLNATGVGGIGKSRLLRHLQDSVDKRWRTASLDLQVPALRQQEDALAVLRGQLGAQGVHFDRFDIAYAVLWQRLHPHLRLTKKDMPFVEASSVLTDIVDGVAGVPVFGTAIGLLKILDKAASGKRERHRIKRDATLESLDAMPNSDLADAVTFLFAEDLRDASTDRPYVVFVDTYEALVPSPVRGGRAQAADSWLRDLVGQLDRGLVVIGSREPLHWGVHDPEWDTIVRICDIADLPMQSRVELLVAGGITEPGDQRTIAKASEGLPFYLNLAVDTFQQTGRSGGALVSPEEILARFLAHVAAEEIGTLEVLSPARVFDYEIFRELAAAHHLPGHRVAWNSLTAYSFIYPAGAGLRFHQLMGEALRRRLTPDATVEIHTLLRDIWDRRAAVSAAGPANGANGARALREAAFHGLRARQMDAADLLAHTDRALLSGGHSAATGMADDLETFLATQPDSTDRRQFATALRSLRTEAAVRLGDAAAAIAFTPETSDALAATVADPVGARLAVAAAHGRRIAGDTASAFDVFTQVWERGAGTAKLNAGLWAADLHMCQGRFREAEALAVQIEALAPVDGHELRGDVARLRHLSCRFAFDFAAADRHLRAAEAHYRAADTVIGLANVLTNRAELDAITDSHAAIGEAVRAIEVQREIGAHHELGKAYTALAIAQIRLGQHAEAAASLQSAFAALDRAGYRSGRARADLYQALLQVRIGNIDDAVATFRRSVAELEAAEVYPTLVLCAARALTWLGIDEPYVTAAAARADAALQPIGSADDLHSRIAAYVTELLGDAWKPGDLYAAATTRADAASGFYNHNIRLDPPAGPVIVRIPIPAADVMDLSIWPEPAVLRAIRGQVRHAPLLLHAQDAPRFQVHEFIDGGVLDDIAPRGTRVPGHVIDDVLRLFAELGHIPAGRIPQLPLGWPADADTTSFGRRLSAITAGVLQRFGTDYGDLFTALGIPADPLATIEVGWARLHPRPFRLLHTDIHRKNMIVSGGRTYFLDWELALLGDPVYDLAVHLHKMAYQPDEAARILSRWPDVVTGPASENWTADVEIYLGHERVKSAIVDTVRYTKLITGDAVGDLERADLSRKLADKLAAARGVWNIDRRIQPDEVLATIGRWAADHPVR